MVSDERNGPGLLLRPGQLYRLEQAVTGNVYLLRVPEVLDRTAFRTELALHPARPVSQLDVVAAVEEALAAIAEHTGEPVPAEQLAALAEHRSNIERAYEMLRQAPFDPAIDRDEAMSLLQTPPLVRRIQVVIHSVSVDYRRLLADQANYPEYVGTVAAQLFLRGWEGNLPPFTRRHDGGPDGAALAAIPQVDLQAIGFKAQQMMDPERRTLGNSPSASGSAPTQTSSSTTGTPPATTPSSTTPGNSMPSESRG